MQCYIPVESADTVDLVPSVLSYKAREREKTLATRLGYSVFNSNENVKKQ